MSVLLQHNLYQGDAVHLVLKMIAVGVVPKHIDCLSVLLMSSASITVSKNSGAASGLYDT